MKKVIEFDIEKAKSGEYKVVTRGGSHEGNSHEGWSYEAGVSIRFEIV